MRLHVAFLPSLMAPGRAGWGQAQICLVGDVIRASTSLVTIVERGFSVDDAYCAGYLVDSLLRSGSAEMTDGASAALRLYQSEPDTLAIFSQSAAGRNVVRLGLPDDVAYCAQRNVSDVVPALGRELSLLESSLQVKAAARERPP